jgi:hypothetical protein
MSILLLTVGAEDWLHDQEVELVGVAASVVLSGLKRVGERVRLQERNRERSSGVRKS